MPAHRAPENIGFPWENQWSTTRMRWVFFLYGHGKAKVQAFAKELAPEGFRVRKLKYARPERSTMLVLTKLAKYKEEDLHTEIRHLRALCKRKGGVEYDSLDVEDPRYDDTSVN